MMHDADAPSQHYSINLAKLLLLSKVVVAFQDNTKLNLLVLTWEASTTFESNHNFDLARLQSRPTLRVVGLTTFNANFNEVCIECVT